MSFVQKFLFYVEIRNMMKKVHDEIARTFFDYLLYNCQEWDVNG